MPVPCFLLFLVSEYLLRKYSRNWTKQIASSIIIRGGHGVQRGGGADPPGYHATLGRGLGWARTPLWCGRLPRLLTPPLRLYNLPEDTTLEKNIIFHEKSRGGRCSQSQIGGVLKLFPAPCRRGDHHRRALHHHACLRSDA